MAIHARYSVGCMGQVEELEERLRPEAHRRSHASGGNRMAKEPVRGPCQCLMVWDKWVDEVRKPHNEDDKSMRDWLMRQAYDVLKRHVTDGLCPCNWLIGSRGR